MASWCLIPEYVTKFKQGLKDGSISPEKLSQMASEERNKYLSQFVGGDNAKQVNSLFESKLLLKNQQAGMITWAKKVAGMTPEAKRDLISRIEKMDRVLSPKEGEQFLKDLASTRLGADVTAQEAKQIFELSNKVKETRALQKEDLTFATESERLEYGRAKVALGNLVNDLKEKTNLGISFDPVKALSGFAGNAKSIKASLDNSAIFRQGWKTLFTNPLVWQKNARKTFSDIVKTFGGKKVMDEINADIISRPTYDLMVKAKLAVGVIEEAFPGTVAEKLPVLGRAYKASETAYTGFLYRQRADVFDKYIQIAQKSGVELTKKELESIGSMVNSLTGRGNLGRFEGSAANFLNNVFFSPRFMKSQFDTLGHVVSGAGGSNFVRREAAINLLKVISGTAGVLAVANAVKPGSVEWDPRSSDFGKVKVGNTRFDVTGGVSGMVTLASRLLPILAGQEGKTKSTTTGEVTPINSGKFGASTGKDVLFDFFSNKASPIGAVIVNLLEGKDFDGNKTTPGSEIVKAFIPIGFSNYEKLSKDPNAPNKIITTILDGLGIGANTYLPKTEKENSWIESPTKAQEAFKGKVGEDKFKEANQVFNAKYKIWQEQIAQNETYKKLSQDAKNGVNQKARNRIEDQVFKDYGFKYKEPQKTREDLQREKELEQNLPKKVSQAIIDKLIPTASASEGDLFGSRTYTFNKNTGETTTTVEKGIIDKIIEEVSKLFEKKPETPKAEAKGINLKVGISPNLVKEERVGESATIPATTVGKDGEIDFKAFPNDQNGAKRKNFTPNQPPQDIADIIKKHFGSDYAPAVLVAATENATYESKRADNVNQSDGSRDRGIFQINSNSFNGLMERQGKKLKDYGIASFEDMYDPDKNAYAATLIRKESKQENPQTNGWGRWFGWQDTGYNINNGWYSAPKRIDYELGKK